MCVCVLCSNVHCTVCIQWREEGKNGEDCSQKVELLLQPSIDEKMHTHAERSQANRSGSIIIIIIKKVFDLSLRFIGQCIHDSMLCNESDNVAQLDVF